MNKRYLVLLAILTGAVLSMAGCGQKGALYLSKEQPQESPQSQPEEQTKP